MQKNCLFALVLAFFGIVADAQTALDRALENAEIGMARAEFLELKKGQKARPSGDFRTEFFEQIQKDGLEGARFFFDNDGARFLYQIDLEFESETRARQSAVEQFGQPNYPKKADHWIFDAFRGGATLAWLDAKKLTIAADLPETEWFGNALFQIDDPEILRQFEPPPPSEWAEEDWLFFFQTLEKQLAEVKNQFKKLRGGLVGEAGSGMVECKEPLAFSIYSSIFQDEENAWTVSNTMAEGVAEEGMKKWLADFSAGLAGRKIGPFEIGPTARLDPPEDIFPASQTERFQNFTVTRDKTPVGIVGVYGAFLGEKEGWAVDFLVTDQF